MFWSDFNKGFSPWRVFGNMDKELKRIQSEMNRLYPSSGLASAAEFPAINVWRNGNDIILTTELPGIVPEELDISVVGKTLTLRGERAPLGEKEETYHRRERWHGRFTRTVQLPFEVNADKVEAKYVKGSLYLTLPRSEEEKPKKIAIKATE
jgi:HSP20 family protein